MSAPINAPTRQTANDPPIMHCANHPDVETLLRCNRCDKPICVKCAVQTPVGYRCKECVREQQKKYFNAVTGDNLIALGVALGVTLVATPFVSLVLSLSWWFSLIIAFLAGSAAGSALAQIIRRAVGRRRGEYLRWFALAGIIIGFLLGSVVTLIVFGRFPALSLPMLLFLGLALASMMPFLR